MRPTALICAVSAVLARLARSVVVVMILLFSSEDCSRNEMQCGVSNIVPRRPIGLRRPIVLCGSIALLGKCGELSLVGPTPPEDGGGFTGVIADCNGSSVVGLHGWPPSISNCAFTIRAIRAGHIQPPMDLRTDRLTDLYFSPAMEREEDDLRLEM
jgi:hypothetical protein